MVPQRSINWPHFLRSTWRGRRCGDFGVPSPRCRFTWLVLLWHHYFARAYTSGTQFLQCSCDFWNKKFKWPVLWPPPHLRNFGSVNAWELQKQEQFPESLKTRYFWIIIFITTGTLVEKKGKYHHYQSDQSRAPELRIPHWHFLLTILSTCSHPFFTHWLPFTHYPFGRVDFLVRRDWV